jgi:hypothetical protein
MWGDPDGIDQPRWVVYCGHGVLAPCPCCGGRMTIIEIFERRCGQQYSPDQPRRPTVRS